ncbi:hypothetical protein ABGN05_03640 [Aquibium sp. LZ166]|uniref:Uncharacterized protein n=1 Tax=Aquibium pacificus TaxID=3153579 RepID=A0ABV3SDE2_9HYPH
MMITYEGTSPPTRSAPRKHKEAIRPFVDAVCDELGIAAQEGSRRDAVERRIMSAWRRGTRHPLNLVSAGLET